MLYAIVSQRMDKLAVLYTLSGKREVKWTTMAQTTVMYMYFSPRAC